MSTDPEPPTTPPGPSTVGRYEIVRAIGHGGMGSIYLARDPKIGNRLVVIKLLLEGFDTKESRERFAREAHAAGALHHANIVTIFDVGDVDGQPFIAMEYIVGETLTELVRRRANLPLGRKIQMMEELCSGLHYAHRAGIVHRDIKPANIMIDREGVLKILDFGIARMGSSSKVTRTGMVVGTLNYMAPEQMAGQALDSRADMFSAGAVFYELLSNRQAFPGEVPGIFHKIMTATHEPLASAAPSVDARLVAVVEKCLACSQEDRYPDMAAVRRELAPIKQRVVGDEQAELQKYVADARSAMETGNLEFAIRACQDALVLDSECGPALELQLEAQALFRKRQVDGHLASARDAIASGALTRATVFVDQALAVDPSSPDVHAARVAVEEGRRRLAQARERELLMAAAVEKARAQLEVDVDLALRTIDDALEIDPEHQEARALKAQIDAIVAAKRQAEREALERAQIETRARRAIAVARAEFAKGHHLEVIAALEAFTPQTAVANVVEELRREAESIERQRAEARRREQEAERRKQEADRVAQEAQQRKKEEEAARQREADRRRADINQQRAAETITMRMDPANTIEMDPASTIEIDPTRTIRIDPAKLEAEAAYDADAKTLLQPPTRPPAPPAAPPIATAPPPRRTQPAAVPAAPPQTDARKASPVLWIAAAVVVVAIGAAALKWLPRSETATAPGPVPATGSVGVAATGTLVIDAVPWARIDRVVNANGEVQPLPESSTPIALQVAPGEYRIELSGPPPAGEKREIRVTVGSNATQVAPVVTFLEMSVDDYFRTQTGGSR